MANPAAVKVNVPIRQLKRALAVDNISGKFSGIKNTPRLGGREEIWGGAAEKIGKSDEVLVLEFGVYKGNSMKFWISQFTNPGCSFEGFDSFTGLPEDWVGKMTKGAFDVKGQLPDIDDKRVSFHAGWIQNTLPVFLKENSDKIKKYKKVLVHIDVDIYSAALFILTTLWHQLDEFYLMFDEFAIDENLAFSDFGSAYPIKYEFYSHVWSQYGMPSQMFCKVEKIPYEPE